MAKREVTLWDDIHHELRDAEHWARSENWERVKDRLSNVRDLLLAIKETFPIPQSTSHV